MKIRKSGIAAAVAALAVGTLFAASTPAIADTPTLTVWYDSDRKADFAGPVATWAAANGVTVTMVGKDFGKVRDLLKTAVPAGVGPDVMLGAAHDWTGNMVTAGVIRPISLSSAQTSSFDPRSTSAFTYNGKLYGVPFYTENIALIRNLHTAPKAPTSAAQIKNGELAVGTWDVTGGDPYHFYPVMSSFGANIFVKKSDGTWSTTVDFGGTAGQTFAKYLSTKGAAFFGGSQGWNKVVCGIKTGSLKYWITGPWAINAVETGNGDCNTKSVYGKDFAISAIPSFGGKTAVQFFGAKGGMLINSANTDVVRGTSLLTYLAGKDAGINYFNVDSFRPANKAALAVASNDPVIKGFDAAGKNAVPMPNNANMDSVWDKWGKTEAKILNGKSTNPSADWDAMVAAEQALFN